MAQARLVGAQYSRSDPSGPLGGLNRQSPTAEPPSPAESLQLPLEFRRIHNEGMRAKFWHYLRQRRFDDVATLVDTYDLRCCFSGRWRDRIIIPFYQQGELIGWTGRALINPIVAPRYLSSSEAVKNTVFNEDNLTGGKLLFITEGPFDALKVDYYGRQLGAAATCTFGTSLTIDQIAILHAICPRYERVVVLFDQDAVEPAFFAQDWLRGVKVGSLPWGTKDPGDLSANQVREIVNAELQSKVH